eukprot:1926928-Lingulodinium_polyedra.AAC.1
MDQGEAEHFGQTRMAGTVTGRGSPLGARQALKPRPRARAVRQPAGQVGRAFFQPARRSQGAN